MLRHSWPRGADEPSYVLMAKVFLQQYATRFLDAKIGCEIEHCNGYLFAETELKCIRVSQDNSMPEFQIIVMKSLERERQSIRHNMVEVPQVDIADSAIGVRLPPKAEAAV
jgi:hypothetical protein